MVRRISPGDLYRFGFAGFVAVLWSLWLLSVAWGQTLTLTSGPFVEYADENVGAYRLIVQRSPERVVVGSLAISVQVHERDSDATIPDAMVRIYATPSEHGERQVAPALNSPDDREYYVGRLEVEESGVWAIDVAVEHEEFGDANLTLTVEVFDRSRGGSNLVFGTILWVMVSFVFVGVAWYLIRTARKNRERLRGSGSGG